jgi:hypothetical protein
LREQATAALVEEIQTERHDQARQNEGDLPAVQLAQAEHLPEQQRKAEHQHHVALYELDEIPAAPLDLHRSQARRGHVDRAVIQVNHRPRRAEGVIAGMRRANQAGRGSHLSFRL